MDSTSTNTLHQDKKNSSSVVQEAIDTHISTIEDVDSLHLSQNDEISQNEGEQSISEQPNPNQAKPHLIDVSFHFQTDEVFNSRSNLIKWCQKVGREIKVVVVTQKSELATPRRIARLFLGCERGGQYRRNINCKPTTDKKHRKSGTKKCGCPFLLKGIPLAGDKWNLTVQCGVHNHELDEILIGHSYAGRLNNDEVDIVKHMSKSGVTPQNILHTLKVKDENNMSSKKTIYNARCRLRLLDMQGMSCIQYTLNLLKENHYPYYIKKDEQSNVVTSLFWCHPESIKLLKCFPHVLIVDCTYKTNRYRMPLFELVGVASTGQTFNVAFVFMGNEKEENYVWALERLHTLIDPKRPPTVFVTDKEQALINSIGKVFPNAARLLCKWHISRNLATNCKKDFETNEEWEIFLQQWEDLIKLEKEEKFNKKLSEFESKWRAHPKCLSYVRTNWLPLKEYFVTAWTKHIMHFGCTTTQRVESAHNSLKDHIKSSMSSFPLVWNAMHTMVNLQIWDLDAAFQMSIIRPKHEHKVHPFQEIVGCISSYAMDIISKERDRGLEVIGMDVGLCGCINRSTYGLPCSHEIIDYGRESKPIPLSSIHDHWKQLSRHMSKAPCSYLDIKDDFNELQKVWDESTEGEKRALKRKIKEITTPSSTLIGEPLQKQTGKGRPTVKKPGPKKNKMSTSSTKRDPSGFEYAKTQEEEKLSQASVTKSKKMPVKRAKGKNGTGIIYLNNIPNFIHPLINKLNDVQSDGHCGFHACALGLQLLQPEAWKQVRKDLLQELELHKEFYEMIWGKEEIERQHNRIEYFSPTADLSYWMEMPSHGLLAANWYNQVLFVVGKRDCTTFLPFFTTPEPNFEKKIFGLAYIEEIRHFIHVEFKQDAALPPPTPEWKRHHDPMAEAWISPLKTRMEEWCIIRPPPQTAFDDLS